MAPFSSATRLLLATGACWLASGRPSDCSRSKARAGSGRAGAPFFEDERLARVYSPPEPP
ncbi:MAG: hypothetical protein WCG47_33450 [Dermatophilaceae bacterium]